MQGALATLGFFIFGGLLTYTIAERRHRSRWLRFERRAVEDPALPFRRSPDAGPTRDVLVRRRAPALIRGTALWSIYMGQMAVPGGLLGLIGVCFGGLGLLSIPGMMLAVRIWRLGYAMLRRDAKVEEEALALRRFAVRLNVVALGIAAALVVLGGVDLAGVSLVLVVYGAVSFAHAAALGRCAKLLADERIAATLGSEEPELRGRDARHWVI
jgi:hypothetical protein